MKPTCVFLWAVAFCPTAWWGCVSAPVYDLSGYPVPTRTLFLQNFSNDSFAPDANVELTEALRGEFSRRGNFVLSKTKDEAALRLSGRIIMYRKEGRLFDNLRQATRIELMVACRFSVRARDGEVFVKETAASVEYSEVEGYRETEETARRRLNRLLAQQVAAATESWFLSAFPVPGQNAKEPESAPPSRAVPSGKAPAQ